MRNKLISSLAGAVLSFAASGFAFAADMAVKAPPPAPAPVPVSTWAGWYVGLNAGGGWGNGGTDNNVTSSFCNPDDGGCPGSGTVPGAGATLAAAVPGNFGTKPSGFIGGGQIGYNWQGGVWVWGLETDFQGADVKGSSNFATALGIEGGNPSVLSLAASGSQKLDWFGTLRGRVGWTPTPPWLVYFTGGLAYGGVKTNVSFSESLSFCGCGPFPTVTGSGSNTRAGWTIGGGFEWMFAPQWSVKAEYLYYDLGNVTLNTAILQTDSDGASFFGATIQSVAHYNGSIARGGLNYHF